MKQSIQKTVIIPKIYKISKIRQSSIKYNDTIYIDTSNQYTIFHFLNSQNTTSTNLSQMNN
jgi:hypothetical protein